MTILSDEIANDPLTLGYASMTDAEVAASLNGITRPAPVPAKDVRRYLLLQGKWPMIVDTAANGSTAETRATCINIIDSLQNFEDFDLQDASVLTVVTAGLAALETASLITTAEKTAILAMGANRQSRARELGMKIDPNVGDVIAARNV